MITLADADSFVASIEAARHYQRRRAHLVRFLAEHERETSATGLYLIALCLRSFEKDIEG